MGEVIFLDLRKFNLGLFAVLMIMNLILALIIAISYHTDIRGVESNVIYTIQSMLLDGNNLYKNPEQVPYAISQYMPFYYIVCHQVISFLDLASGKDVHLIYVICRSLSFFVTISLAFCLGKIMYSIFEFGLHESLLVSVFSVFVTVPWFYLARPDIFVSFFLFSALYFFLRYVEEQKLKFIFLLFSGFLCFFSFYSKQNGLIAFLILASYLILRFRLKDLSIFISGFFLGSLIGYILYIPYSSSFFVENTFLGSADNGIDISSMLLNTYKALLTRFEMIIFICFVAIYFLVMTKGIKKLNEKILLMIYYFVILFIFSCVTSLKRGSAINYFNDVLILSIVILAIASKKFFVYHELNVKANHFRRLLCLLVLSFGFTISVQNYYSYGLGSLRGILTHDDPYSRKIVSFLNSEIEKSSDLYFFATSRFLNNRFPENCILPQIDIVACALPKIDIVACALPRKTFDYSNFGEEIANGNLKFYITEVEIKNLLNVK